MCLRESELLFFLLDDFIVLLHRKPYDLCKDSRSQDCYADALLQQVAMGSRVGVNNLIKGGVSVHACDSTAEKSQPLHWAASFGNAEVF